MTEVKKPDEKFSLVAYLKERFTREKISSFGGMMLAVAGALGYLSGPEVAAIHSVAQVSGFDLGPVTTITGLIGAISVLVPTSRMHKNEAK